MPAVTVLAGGNFRSTVDCQPGTPVGGGPDPVGSNSPLVLVAAYATGPFFQVEMHNPSGASAQFQAQAICATAH